MTSHSLKASHQTDFQSPWNKYRHKGHHLWSSIFVLLSLSVSPQGCCLHLSKALHSLCFRYYDTTCFSRSLQHSRTWLLVFVGHRAWLSSGAWLRWVTTWVGDLENRASNSIHPHGAWVNLDAALIESRSLYDLARQGTPWTRCRLGWPCVFSSPSSGWMDTYHPCKRHSENSKGSSHNTSMSQNCTSARIAPTSRLWDHLSTKNKCVLLQSWVCLYIPLLR